MTLPLPVYNGLDDNDLRRMAAEVTTAFEKAQASGKADPKVADRLFPAGFATVPSLIGLDPRVPQQIAAALRSGKRHLMFYGPPGTGKTTLAEEVASRVADPTAADKWKLITGSSDWSSQDIIGGYQPLGNGTIRFQKGVLLEHFDKPLIIDELNRCDIDKVIGPLFTVLSGQATSLPYLVDVNNAESPRITILPKLRADLLPHEHAPTEWWRLIATINSIDKASLYQMSYALTRRFAWILVDVPRDLPGFVWAYLVAQGWSDPPVDPVPTPISVMWEAVNAVRKVGPAPIIDIIKFFREMMPDTSITNQIVDGDARSDALLSGFYTFLSPMLDGIRQDQAEDLTAKLSAALKLPVGRQLQSELAERLKDAAI